uniref:Uncharacterized protein n=1 Tax=Anguilla anguilla TaxID=7936 RepID=A0A0E9WHJ1_ANGAN
MRELLVRLPVLPNFPPEDSRAD